MNTADRSIALVDAAIRRRFSFIEMHPDSKPVAGLLRRWLKANDRPVERADLLDALNRELGEANRDFQIGPSYLMREEADTDDGLARVWRHDICPSWRSTSTGSTRRGRSPTASAWHVCSASRVRTTPTSPRLQTWRSRPCKTRAKKAAERGRRAASSSPRTTRTVGVVELLPEAAAELAGRGLLDVAPCPRRPVEVDSASQQDRGRYA
ncbi:MAG: hypothetical protein NVV66_08445 [Cellulomonas sp.]|uniref:hypothetical protein n=1 Tax=Cellulomonas sp. TaxID=40001 RepID=UPI0025877CB6|nr:hypothetical protein [Cellulomonas sp.]MCR6704713.1 hypothetical protein [Cellulomonas sp.]